MAHIVLDDCDVVETTETGANAKGTRFDVGAKNTETRTCGGDGTTGIRASGTTRNSPVCGRGGQALCLEGVDCGGGGKLHFSYFTADKTSAEQNPQEVPTGTRCLGEAGEPQAQPITAAMVLRALKRVELPKPKMIVQPPGGRTLVNFDTIFHTEAEPLHRTVGLLGQRVQLRIRPTGFTWTHGDGTTQYTEWAGMKFTKGVDMDRYISHQYTDAYVTVTPTSKSPTPPTSASTTAPGAPSPAPSTWQATPSTSASSKAASPSSADTFNPLQPFAASPGACAAWQRVSRTSIAGD